MTSPADVLALAHRLAGLPGPVEAGLAGFRLVREVQRTDCGFGLFEYEAAGPAGPQQFAVLGELTEVGPDDDDDTSGHRLRVIYDDPSRPARAAVYLDLDDTGAVRRVLIRVEDR